MKHVEFSFGLLLGVLLFGFNEGLLAHRADISWDQPLIMLVILSNLGGIMVTYRFTWDYISWRRRKRQQSSKKRGLDVVGEGLKLFK